MKREEEFARNTAVLAIGKYLPKLFSLITLPIITGRLTQAEYGTYDLITTLVSLLLPIVTLQIQSAAFRFLIDCREKERESARIISNIFFFTVAASIITVAVFFAVYDGVGILTRLLICGYFFVDILQIAIGMSARGLGYNAVYSANSILNAGINAVLIFLLVYVKDCGLNGVLLAAMVGNLIAYFYTVHRIRFFRYIHISLLSGPVLKELIAYSWPMIPNNLSNWVLKLSDRLVITAVLGVEANAVYAVANKIPTLLAEAQSVVVMGWQENASVAAKDKDSAAYYSSMFRSMFSLIFAVTAVLIAAAPVMFAVLIRGDYDAAYAQIPILIIGMFFYCMSGFLGGIYVAHKRTVSVAVTTVAAAAVNLTIDILLVRRIGITAGSVSTLIAYLALFLFRMFDVRRLEKLTCPYGSMLVQLILLVGMCILAVQRVPLLNAVNAVLAILASYGFNRPLVHGFIRKLLNQRKGR